MILRLYEDLDSDYNLVSDYHVNTLHIAVSYKFTLHSKTYYVSDFESGTIIHTCSKRLTHELEKR